MNIDKELLRAALDKAKDFLDEDASQPGLVVIDDPQRIVVGTIGHLSDDKSALVAALQAVAHLVEPVVATEDSFAGVAIRMRDCIDMPVERIVIQHNDPWRRQGKRKARRS